MRSSDGSSSVRSSSETIISAPSGPPKPPPLPPKPPQAVDSKNSPILLLSEVASAPDPQPPVVVPVGPSPFASPVLANIVSSAYETKFRVIGAFI